jgi:hypothetical protein
MKRTTIFVEDDVFDTLRAMARRQGVSLAALTREALAAYVTRRQRARKPLTFVAIGRSGRRDVSERFEELLKEGFGRR